VTGITLRELAGRLGVSGDARRHAHLGAVLADELALGRVELVDGEYRLRDSAIDEKTLRALRAIGPEGAGRGHAAGVIPPAEKKRSRVGSEPTREFTTNYDETEDAMSDLDEYEVFLANHGTRKEARRWVDAHPERYAEAVAARQPLRNPARTMYGGNGYDFARELRAALGRQAVRAQFRTRWRVELIARGDEFEAAAAELLDRMTGDVAGDALLRHARRFGVECVLGTARTHLSDRQRRDLELDLAGTSATRATRQRRTTDEVTEQVIALAERGLIEPAIADTLNISDRRVRAILAKCGTRENGGQKRLDQAGNHAAKAIGQPGRWVTRNGAQNGKAMPVIEGSPVA
jgi:hypothetical protein